MLHLQTRWRKAITTSLLIHCLLVVGSGYLVTRLFASPPVAEQYIELDLSTAAEPQAIQANTVAAATSPQPPESQPAPAAVTQQILTTPAVASTGALAMVSAEVPASTGNGETDSSAPSGQAAGSPRSISAPGILSKTEPSYPSAARQAGQQGTVVLKVQILENGRPGEISVVRSSGYSLLDDAAVDAVEQWRFIPAKDRNSGRAVVCYSTLPISFRLH